MFSFSLYKDSLTAQSLKYKIILSFAGLWFCFGLLYRICHICFSFLIVLLVLVDLFHLFRWFRFARFVSLFRVLVHAYLESSLPH